MAEPMLQLKGVRKRFGELEVLKGVDLDVAKGEVICILGPSGSGKSTLLRCVNLLEPPEEGEIFLEGKDICKGPGSGTGEQSWNLDFVRQRVGMVFQQFNLFPHKTALENVTMAPEKVLGQSKAEAKANGTALLERVGLGRQARPVPRTALRRPAAAGRDRPGAGDGTARDALRRGHQRPRPRARQGGARRDARARLGRDDDARRHPRDGLRPRGRRPGRLHGRRRDRRAGQARRRARQPPQERTKQFLGLVLER